MTAVDRRAWIAKNSLQNDSRHLLHRFFPSLIFQHIRDNFVNVVSMVAELKTCCVSVGAGKRKHPKIRVLRLLSAMGLLPVVRSCLWPVTINKGASLLLNKSVIEKSKNSA